MKGSVTPRWLLNAQDSFDGRLLHSIRPFHVKGRMTPSYSFPQPFRSDMRPEFVRGKLTTPIRPLIRERTAALASSSHFRYLLWASDRAPRVGMSIASQFSATTVRSVFCREVCHLWACSLQMF
jgi:hypothetical protein